MSKKIRLGIIAVVFTSLSLLFAPVKAHALDLDTLQTSIQRSYVLCSLNKPDMCKIVTTLTDIKDKYAAMSTSEKAAAEKTYSNVLTTNTNLINKEYISAAKSGEVKDDAAVTDQALKSTPQGTESCGGVQVAVAVGCSGNTNPIYAYLSGIIKFLGGAIGLAVVVTIIVSGIQYASSAGNAANITQAKERLTNAVIGLVLYLFLAAILRYLVPQIFT